MLASIQINFFLEQVQSAVLTNISAGGGYISSYLALMNKQANANNCTFSTQIIIPLRFVLLQLASIRSNINIQWNSVSGFSGSLCTISIIHVITSSLIYALIVKSEDIYDIALGALDFRYAFIDVPLGLASVLQSVLLGFFNEIISFYYYFKEITMFLLSLHSYRFNTFWELFLILPFLFLPFSATSMLTNLLTLLVPDSDNLLLYEAMIFLRSLPNTRRGAYLEGCSALVWASGVTPLFIIVDMINLNWLLFFIICAYYYILNLSYPFNIICFLI